MIPRAPRTPEQHEAGVLRKWARHDDRMRWIERSGIIDLYHPSYAENEVVTLRSEIARKLEVDPPSTDIGPVSQDEGSWHEILERSPLCGKCGSDDLMEFEHKHWFGCEACNKPTPVVVGCLNCTHIRCPDCALEVKSAAAAEEWLAQASDSEGTCSNCGKSPEALRPCNNCGGRICQACTGPKLSVPICWRYSTCLDRQYWRQLNGPR